MAKPILAWPGGKRRLAKHILPLFENPHQCYVEPFAGGAALLFMRDTPAPVEVLNDMHSELVHLYRCVRHHLDELVRQFRWALASREMFEWTKMERPETLTDIQRAARFLYLQKLAFGAKVSGHTFGTSAMQPPRLNLLRLEEDLSAAHLRLARVTIEHPVVARLHPPLRPPRHPVLSRPAVLADRRLCQRLSLAGVRAARRRHGQPAGARHPQHQRSPRYPPSLRALPAPQAVDHLYDRRRQEARRRAADHDALTAMSVFADSICPCGGARCPCPASPAAVPVSRASR
jgi:hypothetical protein